MTSMTTGDLPDHDGAHSPGRRSPGRRSPAAPPPEDRHSATHTAPREAGEDAAQHLAAFLAEAAARRQAAEATASHRPEDWFDPDPDAAARLRPGADPVTSALRRRKEGDNRTHFAGAVRRACERLQALPARSLTPAQVRAYPWHQLSEEQLEDYVAEVKRHFGTQASINDNICAVRAVLEQCRKRGLISAFRHDLLREVLLTTAPGRSTRRRRLSSEEVGRLLEACQSMGTPAARARNTAIVALLFTTGIRGGELVRIRLENWDQREQTILLRETKNGSDHLIHVHPQTAPLLAAWRAVRGEAPGVLFAALNRDGGPALSVVSLRYMIATRATRAGIAPFAPHDFRRTFATTLLRTHDPALVSKLLNHKKLDSTLVYDMASEEDMRSAVSSMQLPALAAVRDQHACAADGEDPTKTAEARAAGSAPGAEPRSDGRRPGGQDHGGTAA